MEAKDLMIEDWVYDTILQGYTRVKVLTARGIKGDIHENIWDEDTFASIPLTPEILEKNGFEKRNNYQYKYRDNSCKIVISIAPQVEIDGKSLGIPPVNILLEGATFDVNITFDGFVHYLQHALRLCGIEKEITI